MKYILFPAFFIMALSLLSQESSEMLQLTESQTTTVQKIILPFQDDPAVATLDSLWIASLSLKKNLLEMQEFIAIEGEDYFPEDSVFVQQLHQQIKHLRAITPLEVPFNSSMKSLVRRLATQNRKLVQNMFHQSKFYFPLFEEKLAKYGLPLELKYLPIVESALNPQAKSPVGAGGLWQFMYTTGKIYGLDISSYEDERFDPVASTEAACKYLKRLYGIYDDWDLALAAYNSGPGNVNRAIRRAGGVRDFWSIRGFLPRETAGYVPSFYAMMIVMEYIDHYGFEPAHPVFQWLETDTVYVKNMVSFDQLGSYLGETAETLGWLNPSYTLGIIPKDSLKPKVLRLPVGSAGIFASNEEKIYALAATDFESKKESLPEFVKMDEKITYRVKNGDYLGKIASNYGVGVSQIKRWNGLRSNNLSIGQRLVIYPRMNTNTTTINASSSVKMPQDPAKIYVVKTGDSLWTIAQRYPGVTIQNLKQWNRLKSNKLKPGTQLKLCDCSS